MMSVENDPVWVSAVEAARRLGCNPRSIGRLSGSGFITVRRLPQCDPRYLLTDVERLARDATSLAIQDAHGQSSQKFNGGSALPGGLTDET